MLQLRLVGGIIGRNRLGEIAIGTWTILRSRGVSQESSPIQGSGTTQGVAPLPTGVPAHPAVHSTELQGDDGDAAEIAGTAAKSPPGAPESRNGPLAPPKPPSSSSPKLEHMEVGLPSKPNMDYRRHLSNQSAQHPPPEALNEVSCTGLDGSPWPDDSEGQKAQKKAQEEDNKEYFKDHKASPLSELEFVDSRKPITQATDHKADSPTGGDVGVILWREQQLDTAEESLYRAAEIWRMNKMRGDPDSPHGRVLRHLRGDNW